MVVPVRISQFETLQAIEVRLWFLIEFLEDFGEPGRTGNEFWLAGHGGSEVRTGEVPASIHPNSFFLRPCLSFLPIAVYLLLRTGINDHGRTG